jgi:hypothetical protein
MSVPRISLALPIVNNRFCVPSPSNWDSAAGWSQITSPYGTIVESAVDPADGFQFRAQKYAFNRRSDAGTNTADMMIAGHAIPMKLCNRATVYYNFVLSYKHDPGSYATLTCGMQWLDASGGVLLTETSSPQPWVTWALLQISSNQAAPIGARYVRPVIRCVITNPGGPSNVTALYLRFFGIGTWSTSAAYADMSINPSTRSLILTPAGSRMESKSAGWYVAPIETGGFTPHLHTMSLGFEWATEACRNDILRAYAYHLGIGAAGSAPSGTNPGAGSWPLLVIPNISGFPDAGIFRFTSPPRAPFAYEFYQGTNFYNVDFDLIEAL